MDAGPLLKTKRLCNQLDWTLNKSFFKKIARGTVFFQTDFLHCLLASSMYILQTQESRSLREINCITKEMNCPLFNISILFYFPKAVTALDLFTTLSPVLSIALDSRYSKIKMSIEGK